MNIADVEQRLREAGAQRRWLAVTMERKREQEYLAYWIDHPKCFPSVYELAAWKKMRTHVRWRFIGGARDGDR